MEVYELVYDVDGAESWRLSVGGAVWLGCDLRPVKESQIDISKSCGDTLAEKAEEVVDGVRRKKDDVNLDQSELGRSL